MYNLLFLLLRLADYWSHFVGVLISTNIPVFPLLGLADYWSRFDVVLIGTNITV